MRAYTITTGIIFGLITVAHILRLIEEGRSLFAEPLFLGFTVLSAALCTWAIALLRSTR